MYSVLPDEKQYFFQWHEVENFLSFLSRKLATWSTIHWHKTLIFVPPSYEQIFNHSQVEVHGQMR